MSYQIIIVLLLTFIIHLVGTLSYSVRLVGVRTGRIAVSFALFNLMVLVSRTANSFQAPLLAKTIENNIVYGLPNNLSEFRWILAMTTLATIAGAVLIPSFQRIFSKAVVQFSTNRSIPRLLLHAFSTAGIKHIYREISIPDKRNLNLQIPKKDFPKRIFVSNILASAIFTVGVLAALYAGYLNPELRTTASSLSSVINGFATILMFLFIDPFLSVLTDDVVSGKFSELMFRKYIILMVISRILGTLLAQFLLLPAARIIAFIAGII